MNEKLKQTLQELRKPKISHFEILIMLLASLVGATIMTLLQLWLGKQ